MNLVIFSSGISIALLAAIALFYVAYGVLAKLKGEQITILTLVAIANFVLHLGFFATALFIKAPIEEILFVLTVSAAIAVTVTKRKKEGV